MLKGRTNPDKQGMPKLGPNREQTDVLTRLPGTVREACVKVGRHRDVRSGNMAAGPFDDARRTYRADTPQLSDRTVRLYFIPQESATMPGLHVEMVHKETGQEIEIEETSVADADQWKFYDVETALPTGGLWIIRAVAGSDSGCWKFALG